jgi:hypothetical protein
LTLHDSPEEVAAAHALTQLSRDAFNAVDAAREEEIDGAKTLLSLWKCEERMAMEFAEKRK